VNRAYRRRQAKKINTPQKLERVVDECIRYREKEMQDLYQKKLGEFVDVMIVMTAYTLNLEGFGKKRLPKIMERVLNNIDAFRTGHLAPDDFDIIKDEVKKLGVKV